MSDNVDQTSTFVLKSVFLIIIISIVSAIYYVYN